MVMRDPLYIQRYKLQLSRSELGKTVRLTSLVRVNILGYFSFRTKSLCFTLLSTEHHNFFLKLTPSFADRPASQLTY